MSYRVAIAISGAVSLGSYEAGVVYELVDAIGQHNRHHADNPDRQIHIDVLTGASAGGMTATVLAQKLLFDANALRDPFTNALHQAWVEAVDIEGLLRDNLGDDPTRSLLSSNFVGQIASELLLNRYRQGIPQPMAHPAAAPQIYLGLALANLNGIDYAVDAFKNAELFTGASQFVQTRFQDSYSRRVDKDCDNAEFWRRAELAARASGAFPTAFCPQSLLRRDTESADFRGRFERFGEAAFAYVDGGTFNNYPLGMAKNLADQQDSGARDYERRYYFYVSPNCRTSNKNAFKVDTANPLNTSVALASAIFNQARFQDWMLTSQYNHLIVEMDQRAQRLAVHLLKADHSAIRALDHASDLLLNQLFSDQPKRDRQQEFTVLAERYRQDAAAQQLLSQRGEAAFTAWIKAVQVLESGGRLHDKDHMQIYTITAADEELASDGLFAFVGFLDKRFRAHDYNVGRQKARELLQELQVVHRDANHAHQHHLPLTDFAFSNALPDLPNLGDAGLEQVDPRTRRALSKRVQQRLDLWLNKAGMPWLLRKPAVIFAGYKIRRYLKI